MKLVHSLSGNIQNSNKEINIVLDGKNLIISGDNGSGKTSLALSLYKTLESNIWNPEFQKIEKRQQEAIRLRQTLKNPNLEKEHYRILSRTLENTESELNYFNIPLALEYNLYPKTLELYTSKKATLRFFTADRKASISKAHSATASQPDFSTIDVRNYLGSNLEQHLVNLKVRSALAAQYGELGERPIHADEWIESLTKNLKYLFEDETTELHFSADTLRFHITQEGKPQQTFQSLSSGYLAIFEIYADLLMHTEYAQIRPTDFTGVVIIDEIDAHLHVSLQRKILPFFTASFPNIQFIVTTHSPFVLTSVNDAVIYDMTTNRVASDLSMYSYESVVEGLLGVPPISTRFEDTIKKLNNITSRPSFDIKKSRTIT